MTSCTAIVDLETTSDEDFAWAFQWQVGGTNFDFTNYDLMMMVRRYADDAEVYIALDSITGGYGGISFNAPDTSAGGIIDTFNIQILRVQMVNMPAGTYVQSLLLLRPDGLREEIWNGTLTHSIGPTR
jgi:hypothetical protein